MQQEFLLKQLVACALLSKKGQNLSNYEDEGDENDSENPDEDEEQPLGSSSRRESSGRRKRAESFKSESLSDNSP